MTDAIVYVFLSSESDVRGLSTQPDGANLPSLGNGAAWLQQDATSMTSKALADYVRDPQAAMTSLIMRGFYTSPITAKVIPFRKYE
jgi:hypothetical protein